MVSLLAHVVWVPVPLVRGLLFLFLKIVDLLTGKTPFGLSAVVLLLSAWLSLEAYGYWPLDRVPCAMLATAIVTATISGMMSWWLLMFLLLVTIASLRQRLLWPAGKEGYIVAGNRYFLETDLRKPGNLFWFFMTLVVPVCAQFATSIVLVYGMCGSYSPPMGRDSPDWLIWAAFEAYRQGFGSKVDRPLAKYDSSWMSFSLGAMVKDALKDDPIHMQKSYDYCADMAHIFSGYDDDRNLTRVCNPIRVIIGGLVCMGLLGPPMLLGRLNHMLYT